MREPVSDILLEVKNLKTYLDTPRGVLRAVDNISFSIKKGKTFAIVGESGCGKSMTALSIMGLVPEPAGKIAGGEIRLEKDDLASFSEFQMRAVRGKRIAMIFQEPMTSLNPVLTIGDQIRESIYVHKGLKKLEANARVIDLLKAVGIPDPARRIDEYPHQLSGGMKQRVMIAIALAGDPDLLIADEPTTALDVTIQAQVLQLLKDLQAKTGMAILLITHDLGVVYEMADDIAVMYAGEVVELSDRQSFFTTAKHPYSQRLFKSLPSMEKRLMSLEAISGTVPPLTDTFTGCRFEPRCDQAWMFCTQNIPTINKLANGQQVLCHVYTEGLERPKSVAKESETSTQAIALSKKIDKNQNLLKVKNLQVHFPIHKGLFKKIAGYVYAVDGVEMEIKLGQTLALVGESGCGKTTVGKGIIQLLREFTRGEVKFQADNLLNFSDAELREKRADFQIIFQDPYSSMNPRMLVGDIIEEGMISLQIELDKDKREKKVTELLEMVGLSEDMRHRYPHEFSGGQRQRICIARALAVNPKLIVCDEPTSALDVSVQAQILNLLKELQAKLGLAYLFITHDISVVAYLADQIAVMYLGRIVERGAVEEVLTSPKHPYTKALLSAVPVINSENNNKQFLQGDLPSPSNPPKGCHFHPRCPEVIDKCRVAYPICNNDEHSTCCHLYN